ncbi:hypothetical protein MLD38_031778 [Melastoma candidum]|uniref:Uncharacterized protein n=1 Tax=Melastoma candidum TaxID=119954 RepID=A0ACB9MVD2_9MYRT|nr:hypothetical protein MLD38_031778 [Melastoma candidum]
MATQQEDLRQRPLPSKGEAEQVGGTVDNATANVSLKRDHDRGAMARRGARSLLLALSLPLSLTLLAIYLFGHRHGVHDGHPRPSPPWYLPQWILQGMSIVSSVLMGLSAWLVWAEGGFHRDPQALPLYLAQLGLGLSWNPVMFTIGANWVGSAVMVGLLGSLVGCYRTSRRVNPIAGDLVMLCLAWAAILSVINLRVLSM